MKRGLIVLMVLILSISAFSDKIYLKSGVIMEGVIVKVNEEEVVIKLKSGSPATINQKDIAFIESSESKKIKDDDNKLFSEKTLFYKENKKNPGVAAFLGFIVPSAGHAYAGNWGKGLLFATGEIALLAATGYEIYNNYYSDEMNNKNFDNHNYDGNWWNEDYRMFYNIDYKTMLNDKKIQAYMVSFAVLKLWEVFDAYNTAEKYNTKLRLELNLQSKSLRIYKDYSF
ncbi:MAG: hypothetical protein B6I29_00590 [Marinitoga sp. 4572_148]|nr:MAG: hypothetical protein B6I29_00590 [Marinitoga sp. 4572_148]